MAGFILLLPDTAEANDGHIRYVFIDQTSDDAGKSFAQLAFDYDSGIVMYELPAWVDGLDGDPRAQYQQAAVGYPGGYATVANVHGVPALVVERNDQGRAYVDLVLDGVRFELIGKFAPLELDQLTACCRVLE